MPTYFSLGQVPHKRHTQFRRPDGKLYTEQLMGSRGFSGRSCFHTTTCPPSPRDPGDQDCRVEYAESRGCAHFKTKDSMSGDRVSGRVVFLHNNDVSWRRCPAEDALLLPERIGATISTLSTRAPVESDDLQRDPLPVGDYVVIRGTTYMFHPDAGVSATR
jgi:homogentisate 1,2-dioxygenase